MLVVSLAWFFVVLKLIAEVLNVIFSSMRMSIFNLHINGREASMGNGTAEGTSKGETGVKAQTRQLLGLSADVRALSEHVKIDGCRRCTHLAGDSNCSSE